MTYNILSSNLTEITNTMSVFFFFLNYLGHHPLNLLCCVHFAFIGCARFQCCWRRAPYWMRQIQEKLFFDLMFLS